MTDHTTNLTQLIIKGLVHDETFCRKALPHIKPEYFEFEYRSVYELIIGFIAKYNKLPNHTVLDVELRNSQSVPDGIRTQCAKLISEMEHPEIVELDWLLDSTEKWCKDRAVILAIMESLSIIDGKSPDKAEGMIPEILSKALAVTFDTNVGHDYLEMGNDRYEMYHRSVDKIPFDIDILNKITNGGVNRKTLNVVMMPTGVGKSMFMCHLAANGLSQGSDVLYITMEMSEEKIAERIDANLFDINIKELPNLSREMFNHKVSNIAKKTHGKLIIKEYPTGAAHAGHFRALLMELKLKKNFKPSIIFIDYLNICASSRMKDSSNSYGYIKAIAEELRGLAVEFDVPLWSATQVNRGGANNTDLELTDTSECIAITELVTLRDGAVKTMAEVKIGDQITANDDYKTVMFKHHNKMKDCVRISTKSGKQIIVSKDHIFPVKTQSGEIKRISVNTGLSTSDILSSVVGTKV